MYPLVKRIISKLISNEQLVKHEVFLRGMFALLYSGSRHQCTICNKKLRTFLQLSNHDLLCPKCGSLARDRRLWTILNENYIKRGISVLDFSPSRPLARKMKSIAGIKYISTDLSGNFIADFQYDITKLALNDNNIDLIICYHILEHITDDATAMAELYRVLKPGGHVLVQTPFKEGDIYEDYSIISPDQREIHFGQDDHVRYYSVSGLKERLENTGFEVVTKTYNANEYNGLKANETVFIITKP